MFRIAVGWTFVVLASMGLGCAVTDYDTIVDNDQISAGGGSGSETSKRSKGVCNECIVDTKGKAHIVESSQIIVGDPSSGFDETLWMVDQKSDGTRTLSTYTNHSDASGPLFHDDLGYCDPAFNGCAIWTSTDPPGDNGNGAFDGVGNPNCRGFENLSFLTSTDRYDGECGRARIGFRDRLALVNMGNLGDAYGMNGLFYEMNHRNTTIILDNNAGFQTTLPVTASLGFFGGPSGRGRGVLDATNPLLASMARDYADFLDTYATDKTLVTVTYNGVSATFTMGGNIGPSTPARVRQSAQRIW